ncbi:MAG: polysaccharide deacetylase family protein [Rhizobiales bacterium]|nr:polysaccharide deacetylase family protein [Hyphomicrobiales bacterium]
MRSGFLAICIGGALAAPALAASCPGNPTAIGTSRVLVASPDEFPRVGTQQYGRNGMLALNDREIVLTFDDGPLPPYTDSVLQTLATECIKATFFLVGRQATANPDLARRIVKEGHTVGTHSQNHPLTFDQMAQPRAEAEINDGIASVTAALGDPRHLTPYFRIPGLLRLRPIEDYLAARRIAVWSVDFDADDWKNIDAAEVVKRAVERIEQKKRGVLLLHDVQPATALALPLLLQELKTRGYRIVHVVPSAAPPPRLPRVAAPPQPPRYAWPRTIPPAEQQRRAPRYSRDFSPGPPPGPDPRRGVIVYR